MAAVRKAEGFTLLFLEIFIIILNTLAIIVILRFKKKYNPDILIFALAVADLLKAFIPLNMTLVAYLGGNAMVEGSGSCITFGWTAFTLNSGIMLVMTVMAIDRYVAICWPFRYKHYLSRKRLICTIIAVFVFSGLHSMLPLIGVGQMRSYNNGSFCHFDFDSTIPASMSYSIFVLVLGISMLAVVIFCYTRAMFSIRGLIRRQRRMSTPTRDIDNADQKRQAMNRMFARLMIVMMMAFCVSWLLFLIVVLQHVSHGWFTIPPEAHFWSMRLAVLNSVFNPIIGAAMCRPYRRGYMFILCKCLHCCGLCSSYNAEDPWTRSRKISFGSRNSSDRDQNETHTCETTKSPTSKKVPKSKIKTKSSFNSYYDSGIVPDSSEYTGTIRSQQAGVVNNAFELDTTPAAASVTGYISGDGRFKTRPGLNRKRISFKDEVEAKQMAGVPLEEGLVAEWVLGLFDISNPQQHDTLYMSSIAADPPINQNEINGAENGLSIEHQPTSKSASCLGIGSSNGKRRRKYGYSGGDQSLFEVPDEPSSLGRPPGNNDSPPASNSDRTGKEIEAKTMYGVKTPSENSVSYLVFNDKQTTVDNSQKAFISSKSESDHIEGEKSLTEEKEQHQMISQRDRCGGSNQENSTFKTVQITHFPIGRNSDIMTTTLNSKSPHTSTPFSLRSRSFVERTQKTSLGALGEQKARSRSFANDLSVSEANSTKGMASIPMDTTQARREQHPFHPTTTKRAYDAGASFDAQRFKTYGAPLSELLPNLSKTKSFETILSNTRCKADSTAYEGLDLPPFQRHSSPFKEGELQGPYKWSYSEPDLTYTLPATTFLASPCPAGEQRGSVTCTYGPHNERYKEYVNSSYHQRRASSPPVMPLSPNKIYRQLSELSQKDLEREVFC